MIISEVIHKLEKLQDQLGDVPVIICDTDTKWTTEIQEKNITEYKGFVEIYIQDGYFQFTDEGWSYD